MGDLIVGTLAVIGALTITGFALIAAIVVLKDRSRKQQAAEYALLTVPQLTDRLPVADALHLIRARTSRERNPWN